MPKCWSGFCCLVVGSWIVGFFVAVVCAYGCTEYLLVQLDVRRRMLDGGVRTLVIILAANLMSFAILWVRRCGSANICGRIIGITRGCATSSKRAAMVSSE
jgi:hypothetical protein